LNKKPALDNTASLKPQKYWTKNQL
jgi:hypothetical protein